MSDEGGGCMIGMSAGPVISMACSDSLQTKGRTETGQRLISRSCERPWSVEAELEDTEMPRLPEETASDPSG
ncbi:hypothetical protein J6590_037918 [Homalodisca vitripennis]|nr:hypothetical protein J6590_037918 [Homalodisca vitripennis]